MAEMVNDGFGCNNFMTVFFLFFLLAWSGGGMFGNNPANAAATQAELQRGFDTNSIQNKLNALGNGICDSTFSVTNSINQGVNSINLGMTNGFNAITQGLNNLGFQNQQCCCEIKTALHQEGELTRALLIQQENAQLRSDLQAAQLTLGNANQTQNILNALGSYKPYSACPCS